ncbi:MAG TPA: SAF domain-containing protein, partial [Acidimicrobiia bacterium]|nr:SAF domain-containing protein [Acidimicrobiia bacterium]
MLWFQPVPWVRWLLALLIAGIALYVELRPDPSVEAPFATASISPGDVIDETNTEMRRVPAGLLDTAEPGTVATRSIPPGAPVLDVDAAVEG